MSWMVSEAAKVCPPPHQPPVQPYANWPRYTLHCCVYLYNNSVRRGQRREGSWFSILLRTHNTYTAVYVRITFQNCRRLSLAFVDASTHFAPTTPLPTSDFLVSSPSIHMPQCFVIPLYSWRAQLTHILHIMDSKSERFSCLIAGN